MLNVYLWIYIPGMLTIIPIIPKNIQIVNVQLKKSNQCFSSCVSSRSTAYITAYGPYICALGHTHLSIGTNGYPKAY